MTKLGDKAREMHACLQGQLADEPQLDSWDRGWNAGIEHAMRRLEKLTLNIEAYELKMERFETEE